MSPWFSNALLRAQSDERLVELARAGHEGAFVAIVERYRRPLHAFARRLVSEGRVEDVLQQAFVNAWAALDAGAEVRHLRGWLHQIVRHAAIAAARRPGDAPLSEAMPGMDGPQAEVERRLEVRETLHNVAQLPHHQRTVIVQTAVAGRSREEVASDLGLTEGAVRGLLHRARTTLRAAATAITPLPLAAWAASGGARGLPFAELAAGAGASSLAGATVKAGGAVIVSGALATSLATDLPPIHHRVQHRAVTTTADHAKPQAVAAVTATPASAPVAAHHTRPRAVAPRDAATRLVRDVTTTRPATPAPATAPAVRRIDTTHEDGRARERHSSGDDDATPQHRQPQDDAAMPIPVSSQDRTDGGDDQADDVDAHAASDDHGDYGSSVDGGSGAAGDGDD